MEPANEHDPTMDADIVHAVNVNNKKEIAEMKFLTKSLENARHVQANVHRQEEKDLLKQLWKLHKEKERRHPGLDYRRSGPRLRQGSSEQIESSTSSRHGSIKYLDHPKDVNFAHHHTDYDRNSYHVDDVRHAHHNEGYHYPSTIHLHNTAGIRHVESKASGRSRHHVPFIEDPSHHYGPVVAHHRPADYFPHPQSWRGHSKRGYQPSADIPWGGSHSSSLNVIVQPAGYGHSVKEHAQQLKKPKHHNKGKLYQPHHPHHHTTNLHPSQLLMDDIRNAGSYESLTRYITLLDCQSNQERVETGQHRKPHRHQKAPYQEQEFHYDHTDKGGTRGVRCKINEETGVQDVIAKDEMRRADSIDKTEHYTHEREQRKENTDKTKSIGYIGVTSESQSPTMGTFVKSTPKGAQQSTGAKAQGDVKKHSALDQEPPTKPAVKSNGKVLNVNGVGVSSSRSEKGHRTSSDELAAGNPESYRHPHHGNSRTLADIDIHQSSHHHHRYPSHHHPTHHHLEPRPHGPMTAAERKRLAVELLAREYPVLLRHAPTKFDPLDALMCQYLRLSTSNVETLEQMCREAGIEVDAHPHQQIHDISQHVFGIENEK